MISYKKISLSIILINLISFSDFLFADTKLATEREMTEVTFLHFNDFYEIEAQYGKGGLFNLSQAIQVQKQRYPNAIITFGGDLLSPSLYSRVSKGKHMIDALNLLKIDIAVPGNHEFDFGLANAFSQFSLSSFPWIINNLYKPNGDLFDSTINSYIHRVKGLKIGFLGLITPELAFLSADKSQVILSDFINKAQQAVLLLKNQNVNFIVALTHLSLEEDKQLAQVVPGINLILGGHDHYPLSLLIKNTLILKSGTNAEYLGVVTASINPSQPKYPEFSWQLLSTAANLVQSINPSNMQEKAISKYLKNYAQQLGTEKNKYLATTLIALDAQTQTVRSQESNFANILADALKKHYQTDMAIINGGAIRSDKIYATQSSLTTKDILKALPFTNKAVVVEISGKLLLEILEHGVAQVEKFKGRFPQVAGLQFEFSPHLTPGHRVSKVKINNQLVNPDKIYTLATIDYLFQGGDGYDMFKLSKVVFDIEQGELFSSIAIDYLSKLKQIKSVRMGRIKIVNKND
jgi:5'-nucleotidase / UDP-sugar diphosphatase